MALSDILSRGSLLIESPKDQTSSDLSVVLRARLERYYSASDQADSLPPPSASLEDLQLLTATESLAVVEQLQKVFSAEILVGTKDMAQIRTLLSIVFRWGTTFLVTKVSHAWPSKPQLASPSTVIDLTDAPRQHQILSSITRRIFAIFFPEGVNGPVVETFITSALINRHLADILCASITLGWLPKSLSTPTIPVVDEVRPLTMRLLAILPPAEAIQALGGVLSQGSNLPTYVRKSSASLLSRQLQRPEGVRGLFAVMFGEGDEASEAPLDKLNRTAQLLTAPPSSTGVEEYYSSIVPRVVALCSSDQPLAYQRASAFTMSRLLDSGAYKPLTSKLVLQLLHSPLSNVHSDSRPSSLLPEPAIQTLSTFISNGDPSPTLISSLLTPVVGSLYALYEYLDSIKTSDPNLKQVVVGLLTTWGKLVEYEAGINTTWSVIEMGPPSKVWELNPEHGLQLIEGTHEGKLPSLVMPAEQDDELDINTNLLQLFPDPSRFVTILKSIGRKDITSEIFMELLGAYQRCKTTTDSDPLRTLLYLQLIMQIQEQLGNEHKSLILAKPDKMIIFIKHALEAALSRREAAIAPEKRPTGLENLKIVSDQDEDDEDVDSDDDDPSSDPYSDSDEMAETALNLLLALLEGDKSLFSSTMPVTEDIFHLVERLATHGAPSIQPLVRETRMLMTVRMASTTPDAQTEEGSPTKDAQAIYQEALSLLQDPLLPVRAHGIFLLRQLVSPQSDLPMADRALVPAILSIFLQSIQDNDSYMFLNATQGLAAMVDAYGKDVLKGLVRDYAGSLDEIARSSMTQQDMDVKTRIGEALGIVIRRCGDALGDYVDIFIPTIMHMVRMQAIPTALKTSALSLIAEAASTSLIALSHYIQDVVYAMLDLLQTEASQEAKDIRSLDSEPTLNDPKIPPLRRAALHLLGLIFRETARQNYEGNLMSHIDSTIIHKARIVLGYTAATDGDSVVRVMARETLDILETMEKSSIGL